MMEALPLLIFVPLIWLLFSLTIIIFGFLISYLTANGEIPKINLESILKFFAIGLSIHLFYGMITISLRIFDFISILLPFIIIDVIFLLFLGFKKRNFTKKKFLKFKSGLFTSLIENWKIILGFTISLFFIFTFQCFFINKNTGYPAIDPYWWFQNIWFVNKYNFLNYSSIMSYPPGFIIFGSSITSFIADYEFFYFFLKYLPLFFTIINTLVLYAIGKRVFKRKINIFFSIIMYGCINIIFTRNVMPVGSLLANTFGFLFLLFLKKRTIIEQLSYSKRMRENFVFSFKHRNTIIIGLLIGSITLMQPLYGIIYLFLYLSFQVYLILIEPAVKGNTQEYNKLKILFSHQISLICVYIGLISIFIIGTSINLGHLLIRAYLYYFPSLYRNTFCLTNLQLLGKLFRDIGVWLIEESPYHIINKFILSLIESFHLLDFYKQTFQIGIFLVIIGLFFNFSKYKEHAQSDLTLVKFFKFSFIYSFLVIGFFGLFYLIKVPVFQDLFNFMYLTYRYRFFEMFGGYWAILFVLSFNYILTFLKKKIRNPLYQFVTKSRKINIKIKFEKILLLLIILTSGFFYLVNFGAIELKYNYKDSHIESLLYVGEYFEQNPLEREKGVMLQKLDVNAIYDLLVDRNLQRNYYDLTLESSYLSFKYVFFFSRCYYTILNSTLMSQDFKDSFLRDFRIIYEGENGFIFAERISPLRGLEHFHNFKVIEEI